MIERGIDRMERGILLFHNQRGMIERMKPLFVSEGMKIMVASNLNEVYMMLRSGNIQLLLMDALLRDQEMKEIVSILQIRKVSCVPIMVFSSQESEIAKVRALDAGANDYVTDQCNPVEVLARVKSQLRRYIQLIQVRQQVENSYKIGDLEIDDCYRMVYVRGKEIRLTPIEYKILLLLVQQRGRVFSIQQIYEEIWKMKAIDVDNTIAVHIRHIREKIETNPREPQYLKVVWGSGYKVG